jgi:hypothetical protein
VPGSRSSWSYFRARCRAEGVSKARVARTVGRSAALSAEKLYMRRVLPAGIARNIRDGLAGDMAGFARAGAIATGLSITAFSFLSAKTAQTARVSSRAASQAKDVGDGPSTSSRRILETAELVREFAALTRCLLRRPGPYLLSRRRARRMHRTAA